MKLDIKKILAIVGILALLGWLGVGDEVIGTMLFAFAIFMGLALHLFGSKETFEKAGETTMEVKKTPGEPKEPEKTPQETEAEQLKKRLAELEKKPIKTTVPAPPTAVEPKKQPINCQFCDKVCRNDTDFRRHLAFKHLDKIKLDVEVEK